MEVWNLVDALSLADVRRAFHPPLGNDQTREAGAAVLNQFNFSEIRDETSLITNDIGLKVDIDPIDAGTVDAPSPYIQLQAVAPGILSYQPATENTPNRLTLQLVSLLTLEFNVLTPAWWDRWVESRSTPELLIYENIDESSLRKRLLSIAPDDPNPGILFPAVLVGPGREEYVESFLLGENSLSVDSSGVILCVAGIDPDKDPSLDSLTRTVTLRVRYNDHTESAPQPMNPREFFYLLFGEDSAEATRHPFFMQMHNSETGLNLNPDTKDKMWMRPPLRTWKRVIWEAEGERSRHRENWGRGNVLGSKRFRNNTTKIFTRGPNRRFNNDIGNSYKKSWKCNLFVSEICLRAGFKILVHPVNSKTNPKKRLHFHAANSYANHARRGILSNPTQGDRIVIKGMRDDKEEEWAHALDNWLRTLPPSSIMQHLNEAMHAEGRCIILACARKRKFRPKLEEFPTTNDIKPPGEGKYRCRPIPIGHIAIVEEVVENPSLTFLNADGELLDPNFVGPGLESAIANIHLKTIEALRGGVGKRDKTWEVGGDSKDADEATGFIWIQLIELYPGRDPDTHQGLRNLNVYSEHLPWLRRKAERAINRPKLTHDKLGNPLEDKCCKDQIPASKRSEDTIITDC